MPASLVNYRPELSGNGVDGGYQKGITDLRTGGTVPDEFTKFRFFYRTWVEGPSLVTGTFGENDAYNKALVFGLSSDGIFPAAQVEYNDRAPLDNFWGLVNRGLGGPGTSYSPNYYPYTICKRNDLPDYFFLYGGPSMGGYDWYNGPTIFAENDDYYTHFTASAWAYPGNLELVSNGMLAAWPIGATSGAKWSSMWEVKMDPQTGAVTHRFRTSMASVSRDSLELTESAEIIGNERTENSRIDALGGFWRDANGKLKFPPYLLMRYPNRDWTWRLDQYKVQFLNADDDELGVISS